MATLLPSASQSSQTVVPLSDSVTVGQLGGSGQLAQAAPALPEAVQEVADGTTALGAVDAQSAETSVQDVAGILAPLLVGGALLAGVLGLSAQERKRRRAR